MQQKRCLFSIIATLLSLSFGCIYGTNNESHHSMLIERNQHIILTDGAYVSADIFRPSDTGKQYPVIFTYGPYAKDTHFKDFNSVTYSKSTVQNDHMVWETPDPETWVKDDYIIVRIDQRGSGNSPGEIRILSKKFANDLYDVTEWLGTQSWSNGKVGMLGVSFYAVSQWIAAEMNPPHLAAIIPWEGFTDAYRDAARQGGIFSSYCEGWFHRRIKADQFGKNIFDEDILAQHFEIPNWPEAAAEAQLATDPFWNDSFLPSLPHLKTIEIPVYSSGNWGGFSLHGKGNIDGFQQISSRHKWLQMHTGNYVNSFYGKEGVADQKRFFDQFLKGIDNDMFSVPPIKLAIRYGSGDQYFWRYENEWPIARTLWTPFYLDANKSFLNENESSNISKISYSEKTGIATFLTSHFVENVEVTGPIKLKLWISSNRSDADLFVMLKKIDYDGKEMSQATTTHFPGPVTKGWLRASHRKLDVNRSKPYQPYHTHDEIQPLHKGEIVPVEIEVWPTSMVFESGTALAVVISGADDPATPDTLFRHESAADACSVTTIWTGLNYDSHILLPIIPKQIPLKSP